MFTANKNYIFDAKNYMYINHASQNELCSYVLQYTQIIGTPKLLDRKTTPETRVLISQLRYEG